MASSTTTTITTRVAKHLALQLKSMAERKSMTVSELLVVALKDYMDRNGQENRFKSLEVRLTKNVFLLMSLISQLSASESEQIVREFNRLVGEEMFHG